jgi:hypothetical protein
MGDFQGHPFRGNQWTAGGGVRTVADSVPALTKGDPRMCFENARREFLAQKAAGKNPVYVVGEIRGYHIDNPSYGGVESEWKPIPDTAHAWVEVDGKVVDSTPFKYGTGDFAYLPTRSAKEHFRADTRYVPSYRVPEEQISGKPLTTFPPPPIAENWAPGWEPPPWSDAWKRNPPKRVG